MRRKITTDYAAGILEKVGGFALHRNPGNGKHYLYFKVITDDVVIKQAMDFLQQKFLVFHTSYPTPSKYSIYINQEECVEKLIKFIKLYCFRTDYKRFRKTKKGYKRVDGRDIVIALS